MRIISAVVKRLFDCGIDFNHVTGDNQTAYSLAVKNNSIHPKLLDKIKYLGADPNFVNEAGMNVYHMLFNIEPDSSEAVIDLLDRFHCHKVDINKITKIGFSPLYLSARFYIKFPEFAERLIINGANPNYVNYQGKTFLSLVSLFSGDTQLIRRAFLLLLKYGFDIELLDTKTLKYLDAAEHLATSHITKLHIYNRTYTKFHPSYPLKVKNAQSMLQVLYQDISKYSHCNIFMFEE
jgi:hypothetical protein